MENSSDLWKKIEKEILRVQDLETIVLKCHLLVESQINYALMVTIGSSIEHIRLSFTQKLKLLACMFPWIKENHTGGRSYYQDWKELNTIRNRISHQLTPKNLRSSLRTLVTHSLGYKLKTINRIKVLKRNLIKTIIFNLALFHGRISHIQYIKQRGKK